MNEAIEQIEKLAKEIKADSCIKTRTRNEHPACRLDAIKVKVDAILSIIQFSK